MDYTQLFRRLREAKGLSHEHLARLARRHRNTVANVEAGRPVKFKTIADLMVKMGYPFGSAEMKGIALLWLESVSGLSFSREETVAAARKNISHYRRSAREAARQLTEAAVEAGLTVEQINLLGFAAVHPEVIAILEAVRDLVAKSAVGETGEEPLLKVAEDKSAEP